MYEKIKIGDKVRCIKDVNIKNIFNVMKKDSIYRIVGLRYKKDLSGYGSFKVIDDRGKEQWFDAARLITGTSKYLELTGRSILLERKAKTVREIRGW